MTDTQQQLKEDRALRDAARALVKADVANLRADLTRRGIGARVIDRMGEGARDVFEEAVEIADDNRGTFAALVGALMLFLARNPILSFLFGEEDDDADEDVEYAEE